MAKTALVVTNLVVVLFFSKTVNSNLCSKSESIDITQGFQFDNGSIIYDGVEYVDGTWYESVVNGIVLHFGCPCIFNDCIWKCCDVGNAFFDRSCDVTNHSALHPFSPEVFNGTDPIQIEAHQHFFFMFNLVCQNGRYLLDSESRDVELYIQKVIFITHIMLIEYIF